MPPEGWAVRRDLHDYLPPNWVAQTPPYLFSLVSGGSRCLRKDSEIQSR